jgi:hypothetical protein
MTAKAGETEAYKRQACTAADERQSTRTRKIRISLILICVKPQPMTP